MPKARLADETIPLTRENLMKISLFADASKSALSRFVARTWTSRGSNDLFVRRQRALSECGRVVHVLSSSSLLDAYALDIVLREHKLPDLGASFFSPRSWTQFEKFPGRLFAGACEQSDEAKALAALSQGRNVLLPFVDSDASLDDMLVQCFAKLVRAQRNQGGPISLVPEVMVWTNRPGLAFSAHLLRSVIESSGLPADLRNSLGALIVGSFPDVRSGESIRLDELITQYPEATDEDLALKAMATLRRRIERERTGSQSLTRSGSPDRVRQQVLRSPKLARVIAEMAGGGSSERQQLIERAEGMLRKLESRQSSEVVEAFSRAFDEAANRMYTALEIDAPGIARLRELRKDANLVLLPSHKSHVDYILLSQVLHRAGFPAPIIAAGDNLDFFPMGSLLRRGGAFFIRRKFQGDKLYAAVVDAYMRRILKNGYPIEFFLEGGRSRTGKLLAPKVGLLSMIVDASVSQSGGKPVYFCPVSIGYERVVEDDSYAHELTGGEKTRESMRALLSRSELLLGTYGRVNVQIGEPLLLREVLPQGRDDQWFASLPSASRKEHVLRLGHRVMNEINRVTAVTPASMVALVLLTHPARGITMTELLGRCESLAVALRNAGARFAPSAWPEGNTSIRPESIREACDLFLKAGHLDIHVSSDLRGTKAELQRASHDAIYAVKAERRLHLDFSKNLIVHFFLQRAVVASIIATGDDTSSLRTVPYVASATQARLRERVQVLSKFLKYEFSFPADSSFDTNFDLTLRAMEQDGELARIGNGEAASWRTTDGEGLLRFIGYCLILRNFAESYRIAARSLLALLKGPSTIGELSKRAVAYGEKMYFAGEIELKESIAKPPIENAYRAFVDLGYLTLDDGKLALTPTYDSEAMVGVIETYMKSHIVRA